MSESRSRTRVVHRLTSCVALVASTVFFSAGAVHASSRTSVGTTAVPAPTSRYAFDSDYLDPLGATTITPSPSCPVAASNPCITSSGFGSDVEGRYWTWSTTQGAGGGFQLVSNSPIASTYTLALKFSLSDLAAGRSNYTKVMDFDGRDTDSGIYFQFGRAQLFPGGLSSSTLYTADTTLTLVVKRQSSGGRAGTVTVYMVGTNKALTKLFTYVDEGGATLAAPSGSGSQLGFFYDDNVTAQSSGEASPSGRVYDLRMWSGLALTDAQISEVVLPPSPPTAVSTVADDTTALVQWTGNTRATSYIATASPGGSSCTATAPTTSCTISGLTNGTSYSVTVVSVDARGASANSAASTVIPRTVPSAPTDLSVTNGNGRAQIVFTPGFNGGRAITNYQYSLDGGSWTSFSPVDITSPVTITGLTNGVTYSIELRAVNSVGAGDASAAVNATPFVAPIPPDPPTNVAATPGNGTATVSFTPGAVPGSTVANYEYSSDGGRTWTAMSPADTTSPITITGLTNGTAYSFLIRAVSAAPLNGDPSEVVVVTPRTTPSAPTNMTASSGDQQGRVTFTASDNGGSAITKYQYSINSGKWTDFATSPRSTSHVLSGLTNGKSYSVRVRAVNAAGVSSPSDAVTIRPTGRPSAPKITDVYSEKGKITVTFTSGSSGGKPITAYMYSLDGGATWSYITNTATPSPFVITNLVDGEIHKLMVRAMNANGTGTPSIAYTTYAGGFIPELGADTWPVVLASLLLIAGGALLLRLPRLRAARTASRNSSRNSSHNSSHTK